MEINGKTFLISGGGSGLGAATAEVIAQAGGKVVVADINQDAGNSVVGELGEDRTMFVKTDVSDDESLQGAVEATLASAQFRRPINSAGIGAAQKTMGKNG